MIPGWLHLLSIASLVGAFLCSALIAADEVRRPQSMWIMNLVWPITALYAGPLGLWFYLAHGRAPASKSAMRMQNGHGGMQEEAPFPIAVAKGALHCGSGCTLGDILAEWLAFAFPVVAIWFGWQTLFEEKMFAVWILDYIFAFILGIAFQYFTITPMRNLSPLAGLKAALKADALSLSAWQIGMYGFMAIAQFILFRRLLGLPLEVPTPEFWFMMQIAMLAGFVTAYPVNWWLIRVGIKERM